uniref:Arabinogalactan peptide 22 n=1 Tax=Oryza brachyantha TaxID=4533 RepID=J3ND36_ORYBR
MASTASLASVVLLLFMFAAALSPAALREVADQEVHAASARRRRPSSGRPDGKAIDQGIGYILMALALVLTYVLH